jgi:hypothetical protein
MNACGFQRCDTQTQSPLWMSVQSHQLSFRKDVALHRLLHLFAGCAGFKVQARVQSIEVEKVAMGLPGRGAGTSVAQLVKIIRALYGASRDAFNLGNAFADRAGARGKVINDPMDPGVSWRIRVGDDQREALCARWRIRPAQGRRRIFPFAGVAARNRIAAFERIGFQLQACSIILCAGGHDVCRRDAPQDEQR